MLSLGKSLCKSPDLAVSPWTGRLCLSAILHMHTHKIQSQTESFLKQQYDLRVSLSALYQSREDNPQKGWCSPPSQQRKGEEKPAEAGERVDTLTFLSSPPCIRLRSQGSALRERPRCDQTSGAAADGHVEVNSAFCSINLCSTFVSPSRRTDSKTVRAGEAGTCSRPGSATRGVIPW